MLENKEKSTITTISFPDGLLSFPVASSGYELVKAPGERAARRRRVVYLRASTEAIDHEDEIVDVSAMSKGSPYFVNNGWLDWNHYSNPVRFPRILAEAGQIPGEFIIGRPLEYKTDNRESFVKGYLYERGKAANVAWDLIQQDPGKVRASVGGGYLSRKREFSKAHGKFVNRVTEVFWNHTAICPEGINSQTAVSSIPFGPFAKAFRDVLMPFSCPDNCIPGAHCAGCARAQMSKSLSTNGIGGSVSLASAMPEDLEGSCNCGKCKHMNSDGKFISHGAGLDHMIECLKMSPERACAILATSAMRKKEN